MPANDKDPILFRAGLMDEAPLPLEGDYLERLDFSCAAHTIRLNLGGIPVAIRVDDSDLRGHVEKKYGPFLCTDEPEVELDVRVQEDIPFETEMSTFSTYRHEDRMAAKFRDMAGYIDLARMRGKAIIGRKNFNQDFENFLRPVMCAITPRFDAVLFHTSALERDGEAYIFFGPSGAGKSTLTKLSSHLTVLSDDMVILRQHGDAIYAHTCGFWGGRTTEYPTLRVDVPVRAFFPLKKSESNEVRPMSRAEAVLTFLTNIPSVARTVAEQEGILDLARAIADRCPFFELSFSKEDGSFWNVIDDGLKRHPAR